MVELGVLKLDYQLEQVNLNNPVPRKNGVYIKFLGFRLGSSVPSVPIPQVLHKPPLAVTSVLGHWAKGSQGQWPRVSLDPYLC